MQIEADIYFHDEVPRIGCGWRRVTLRVGPVWVRIEERSTGKRARLPRKPLDGKTMRRYDMLTHLKPREVQ